MATDGKTRVLIADDYPFFRLGLRVFLEEQGGFKVVGEAASDLEAVERVHSTRPDIILLDLDLPGSGGTSLLERLRAASPDSRFVVLSRWEDEQLLMSALQSGAEGFVLKTADPQVIVLALRAVHRGEQWLQRELTTRLLNHANRMAQGVRIAEQLLTPRELEVLKLLAAGQRNSEIANQLYISERTVKAHVSSMLHKLNLPDRLQAARYAIRNGLVGV